MSQATAEDLDQSEETLSITDGEEDAEVSDDRGDNLEPALDEKALKQVADEPEKAEKPGETTDDVAADDGAEGQRQPANRMIPLSRFNEVNERAKELAEQNRLLAEALARGQQEPEKPAEPQVSADQVLAEKRSAHLKALMDGDEATASKLQGEIDAALIEIAEQRALQRFEARQQERSRQSEAQELASTAAQITAQYPELDHQGEQANQRAIRFVVSERDALIADGKSPAQALREASQAAAELFGFGAAKPPHTNTANSDNRSISSATRNAKAADAQPPNPGGVGNRASQSPRQNVDAMTEEEFDALPAAEKKRMRGD